MKNANFMALIVSGAVILSVGAALAHGPRGPMPSFSELDANADGELTEQELQNHRSVRFQSLDADSNGSVTVEELDQNMRDNARDRAERIVERLDANGDGALSEDEMAPRRDRAGRMFDRIDADNSGTISEDEFETARDRVRDRADKRSRSN
ncbi:MAG: calcium-binding protein [Pseudomonadota bacterium]